MIRKTVPVVFLACLVLLLAGCHKITGNEHAAPVQSASAGSREGNKVTGPLEQKALSAGEGIRDEQKSVFAGSEAEKCEMTESQEETADPASEESGAIKPNVRPEEGRRADAEQPVSRPKQQTLETKEETVFGGIQRSSHPSDVPPKDTVRYTQSRREEIMETRYVESVVDENDPSTYQIIKKEPEVSRMYVNRAGDVKYAYENGVWYEYKYSSGSLVFDHRNDELARTLLKPGGKYDCLEVLEMDCQAVPDERGETLYRYHVRYQGIRRMDRAPAELGHLRMVEAGLLTTELQEEKVPVLVEVRVGTGKYRYYGWQRLDGRTYYFDEHGEKVTGSQVIQGIRHEFDEQGVKISTAGVEVSQENGAVDWEKAAASGIDLAMIQCAYRDSETGILTLDSRAAENLRGAEKAGLKTGICLYSQAVTEEEALEEAEFLIRMAEKYEITGPAAVKTAYANPERNGRADRLGREARTDYVKMCCDRIREAGYTPMVHAEEAFLTDALEKEKLSECQLWLTIYDSGLTYTGPCAVRQYTDRGTVNGISGYAGLNISSGNCGTLNSISQNSPGRNSGSGKRPEFLPDEGD